MDAQGPIGDQDRRGPAFVSYATADRKQALTVCKAIEKRGVPCWISTRDVEPGQNYQEAIVRAIRDARAVLLIFSGAANNSDEIKKELSLASRYRIPVIALRIEDVEPSDAFAYELSTRQWIDAFDGADKALDALASSIQKLAPVAAHTTPTEKSSPPARRLQSRGLWLAGAFLLLAVAAGLYFAMLRPSQVADHPMEVRLAGFQLLSADLPATMRDAVATEVIAAFNKDGVVGVSTASAPAAGTAPAYALGGTIQRDGDTIRVITRLTNERSGATLWSGTFNYAATEASAVPRHVAVDAGNAVRCGLFGASTYRKPLPDDVLKDYMQFCQGYWNPDMAAGRSALVPAQRVVAKVPDFSWGWAAITGAYWKVAFGAETKQQNAEARARGREAADRAIAIDPRNSEALYIKAVLLDRGDWLGREALFKRAVGAQRLDCGCEHHQYGWMLAKVGRITDGIDQLRTANDTLALYVYTPLTLAEALVAAGKPAEAKPFFDAAVDLAPNAEFAKGLAAYAATQIGDLKALADPALPFSPVARAAWIKGFQAVSSGDAAAKAQAAEALMALPVNDQNDSMPALLARLGANAAAFDIAVRVSQGDDGPLVFWSPAMRKTLDDPRFPALAQKLGLMNYWKQSHTRPDVCSTAAPPAFCRSI